MASLKRRGLSVKRSPRLFMDLGCVCLFLFSPNFRQLLNLPDPSRRRHSGNEWAGMISDSVQYLIPCGNQNSCPRFRPHVVIG